MSGARAIGDEHHLLAVLDLEDRAEDMVRRRDWRPRAGRRARDSRPSTRLPLSFSLLDAEEALHRVRKTGAAELRRRWRRGASSLLFSSSLSDVRRCTRRACPGTTCMKPVDAAELSETSPWRRWSGSRSRPASALQCAPRRRRLAPKARMTSAGIERALVDGVARAGQARALRQRAHRAARASALWRRRSGPRTASDMSGSVTGCA